MFGKPFLDILKPAGLSVCCLLFFTLMVHLDTVASLAPTATTLSVKFFIAFNRYSGNIGQAWLLKDCGHLIKCYCLRCETSNFINIMSKLKLPLRKCSCWITKCFFSSHLSGHNLPEEHCKYTKQSFLSHCLCLSHITHLLLTHHTYNVVRCKEYAFFFLCTVHSV